MIPAPLRAPAGTVFPGEDRDSNIFFPENNFYYCTPGAAMI